MINKIPNFVLALLFTLFYTMAWAPLSQAYLIFIAFVPLFIFIDRLIKAKRTPKRIGFILFSLFFCTSLILHYWITFAHWGGTLIASIIQSLILFIPSYLYYKYAKNGYKKQGLIGFTLAIISIEYLQNFWDLSWPWFNLGHSLSSINNNIQWYQYTGSIGGSLYIIIINIVIYKTILSRKNIIYKALYISIYISPLFIPITPFIPAIKTDRLKVIVYQPNLDAYTEKFTKNQEEQNEQLQELINYLKNLSPSEPAVIVCPETFINRAVNEDIINTNQSILLLQNALISPNHYILCGANTLKKVDPKKEIDKSSIRYSGSIAYKTFNSAIFINQNTTDVYHKSKLVAGAETTPFSSILSPILGSLLNIDLGGISGNLGKNDKPKVFSTSEYQVSPIICFESAFGDYTSEFSEIGSDFIAIITNDDWWGNTSGHKHHFELARIRAIENQKYIVRSANTGISGIISPSGNVIESLPYKTGGFIESEIFLNPTPTYFTQNKHLIGKLCTFVLAMLLLQMETLLIRSRKRNV